MVTTEIPAWHEAADAVEFVARLSHDINKYNGLHRRCGDRVPIAVPVKIELLGDSLNPVGEPFHGITRDISHSGVGLYHAEKITVGDDDTVFVQVSAKSLEGDDAVVVVGQIRHTNAVGHFHHTGIEFLFGVDEEEEDA